MAKFLALVGSLFVYSIAGAAPEGAPVTFEKVDVQVAKAKLVVELALDDSQRAHGLMFRQHLPADQGMLFYFEQEHRPTFWMKNTLIPLSIAFIDSHLKIIDIQDMNPSTSLVDQEVERHTSSGPAQFALEVNQGWFAKHKVSIGSRVKLLSTKVPAKVKRIFSAGST